MKILIITLMVYFISFSELNVYAQESSCHSPLMQAADNIESGTIDYNDLNKYLEILNDSATDVNYLVPGECNGISPAKIRPIITQIWMSSNGHVPRRVLALKALLAHPQLNLADTYDSSGLLPLAIAAEGENIDEEVLQILLHRSDVDINAKSVQTQAYWPSQNLSALSVASTKATPILLSDSRINVNSISIFNFTPLILAVDDNNLEKVKLLVRHPKIDLNITAGGVGSALHWAKEKHFKEIEIVLENAGAQDLPAK